ncbi:MAG: hypothetical protein G01um101456_360 [Parcubacteria group bacterium Gr01-1014_56]|nr:MAG: hypothetical protein G01um101456_360 [Parcubacteria group bacterium Gr01-1014_56]
MNKTQILLGVGAVLVLGALFVFTNPSAGVEQSTRTNREVATACDREMAQGFHIHSTLEIVVNGEEIVVPANIGVRATCMTALHTHTPDGLIHVESPEKRDFTLADFFVVWGQPFSENEILGYKADATHQIKVTVSGEVVDTFENTILRDGEKIAISYEPRTEPSSTSGIKGTVMLGPTCPVMRDPPDPACADKPYKTTLVLTTPDGARVLKTFSSDEKGVFSLQVQPGDYAIRSAAAANILPYCASTGSIKVRAGIYTTANVSCDTGIR